MTSTSPYRHDEDSASVLTAVPPDGLGFYSRHLGASPTRVWEQTTTTDLLILSVSGDLDTLTAPVLERNLSQPLPTATVLDLSRVSFLGVAGLRVLEAAATRAGAERRRIGLVTGSASTRRIMRLFDLDLRVAVYPRLEEAVRELT
ncbi:hypothetical protein GCM10027598_59440 [Amycolatopsis oliviviridis]|uniref:STAS domain-containing protein n=1 Tax=Amycolatopsis oliviviridis TaxID=1471590 RepID=A0ABQ3M0E3_9PSEU|nr:STAS domain-containing protein [Amycolatopsis oliviviridis]GHH28755.1 hypothetical protein GCM10017790_60090 [Amycolatopsis oliviviridis]